MTTELELKILLDAETAERLRAHPALAGLRAAPSRSETLVSVYHDTPDERLAQAGIALRLRRVGRRWVQTVKLRRAGGTSGLHANLEIEEPAPGGRLALDREDGEGAYAAVRAALDGAVPEPRFETRVRRQVERLAMAERGMVELALDRGEVIAGALSAPIREAELELVEGEVGAIFAAARALFDRGPIRFAPLNKAERGRRLAATGRAEPPPEPRKAGDPDYAADAPAEAAARAVLRDCFGQIAGNMALIAESDDPEAAHQLRVGLRRLRTAFGLFKNLAAPGAFDALGDAARDLGRATGRLRDLDVLIGEALAEVAGYGLDDVSRDALGAVLEGRRRAAREALRDELAGPAAVRFLFDLAETIEAPGGLGSGAAEPIDRLAPGLLKKRLKRVRAAAAGIERLGPEELHALRKELKKLRYGVEALAPVFPEKKVAAFIKPLKALQGEFGSLNDATMAAELLGGAGGKAEKPEVARAVGFLLGALAVKAERDRPQVFARWAKFEATKPFWT